MSLVSGGPAYRGASFNLAQVYDHDLEALFVEPLQVTRLTVRLVYNELLTLGDKQTAPEHA